MEAMFGFWLMCLAITSFIVFVCGIDLSTKEKILMVFGFQLFIGLLEFSLYLMGIR